MQLIDFFSLRVSLPSAQFMNPWSNETIPVNPHKRTCVAIEHVFFVPVTVKGHPCTAI